MQVTVTGAGNVQVIVRGDRGDVQLNVGAL
jgi:microcompartment protein CcmL/EutN